MFKIGYMEYANVYPIFYYLLKNKNLSFFKSYPAELNKAMREGRIDLSPSSSIEYAKNSSLYKVISGISVSSVGAVKSVNVFSNIPLEKMGGKKIYFTKESNTSTVLTRIIFEEFYKIPVEYTNSLEEAHAELLIGDKALYSYYNTDYKYIFDLGQEWYKFTGLPFASGFTKKSNETGIACSSQPVRGSVVLRIHTLGISAGLSSPVRGCLS